ncbi:hypothetical protein DMH04_18400 [Kibdelosporangium aridum]|uniref:Uncharacterized protein n=1 Tax=Kibdelosporangium aridum TaxID=2030 RepID=A0A428ZB55_KIBAR|nr:hypothetical protein [Kibdelosporangium aridum]RSM85261.1 hypothetical protein DMH04_18400 [Kibdelosporangium aridum]
MSNYFGPIDPYVLLPVAALGSMALVLLLNGIVMWGLAAGVLAGLLLAFDSWANRTDPILQRRRNPYHRTRPPYRYTRY